MIDVPRVRAETLSWPVMLIDVRGSTPSEDGSPCAAIPAASRHGWRTDIGCASTANADVAHDGRVYPVCKIHLASWRTAFERGTHRDLAKLWGWA